MKRKLRYKIFTEHQNKIIEVGEADFLFTAFNLAILVFEKKHGWVKIKDCNPGLPHKLMPEGEILNNN